MQNIIIVIETFINLHHIRILSVIVYKEIRNTIKKLGGTMPEELPTPDKSLKELDKENKFENNLIK